jgi:hypothetical protein
MPKLIGSEGEVEHIHMYVSVRNLVEMDHKRRLTIPTYVYISIGHWVETVFLN